MVEELIPTSKPAASPDPQIKSPATLTRVLCSEHESLSFGISLGNFG